MSPNTTPTAPRLRAAKPRRPSMVMVSLVGLGAAAVSGGVSSATFGAGLGLTLALGGFGFASRWISDAIRLLRGGPLRIVRSPPHFRAGAIDPFAPSFN